MIPVDPSVARELLEALIAGFAVLGGFMAYASGFAAYRGLAQELPSPQVTHRINEGLGEGFVVGAPVAVLALMIMGWMQ